MSRVKKVRKGDGGVSVRLEADEAALTRALMEQILALIADPDEGSGDPDDALASLGITERTSEPEDPVLARLFPDGYRDDPEAAGEFRRYTEVGLREGKKEAATTVLETLRADEEVVLDKDQAQAWLRAINDVRLALGTRLDVSEDWPTQAAELEQDDPRYPIFVVYDWLTELQDSLIRAL